MDNIKNPFAPGAGSPPPELAGRQAIIGQADVLIGRTKAQRSEKSIILIGLRGVGKTVLLNTIAERCRLADFHCLQLEATEDGTFTRQLVFQLRTLLLEIDRSEKGKKSLRDAMSTLAAFARTFSLTYNDITLGFNTEPIQGIADSGDLETDLPALMTRIGLMAKELNTQLALVLDELQYLKLTELTALVQAMHIAQQRQLPIIMVCAGLPTLPAIVGKAKSYAERLFSFQQIGALSSDDVANALNEPVEKLDVRFEREALDEVYRTTNGFPYFVQEWGYQSWNVAEGPLITAVDVLTATPIAQKILDNSFFRVRFERLNTGEKKFMRAMAECGTDNCLTSDVAKQLSVKLQSLGPRRQALITKGMVYSPTFGELAFTVPLFGDFMKRIMPANAL